MKIRVEMLFRGREMLGKSEIHLIGRCGNIYGKEEIFKIQDRDY